MGRALSILDETLMLKKAGSNVLSAGPVWLDLIMVSPWGFKRRGLLYPGCNLKPFE